MAESALGSLTALDRWYENSGVRSAPRRGDTDADISKHFFPSRLVPHLNHPRILSAEEPVRRYLEAQHLYQWLQFTAHFEVSVVNRATLRIATGNSGLELADRVQMDAFKIYVDEGYHSLYSLDVCRELERRSGIPALRYAFAPYLAQLDSLARERPEHERLIQLLQVVVFETLITSILSDIPGDAEVITTVRDIVRDHAIDEGRHHAYFAAFFTDLYGQLLPEHRLLVGRFLPELIFRSLEPATRPATAALLAAGFAPRTVTEVVRESYDQQSVAAGIRRAAHRTIRLFEQHGILAEPGAHHRFAEFGLLPDDGPS